MTHELYAHCSLVIQELTEQKYFRSKEAAKDRVQFELFYPEDKYGKGSNPRPL